MPGDDVTPRLLDRRRLRALSLGLRGPPAVTQTPDPDSALLSLLDRPFETVDGAHDRLRELELRLRRAGDRRAVFPTIYTRMTDAVRTVIETGGFADPAWMRRYTTTFADYYRRAFLAFEQGEYAAVPPPWRVAFETAVAGTALVAQDAFLGINAHINYDLALTLREVGIDPDRAEKRTDHDRIDEVLTALIDAQQVALAELYAPGLAAVDEGFGRLDEALSLFSITEGRAWAWRVAVALTHATWTPLQRAVRWLLRTTATGTATFVRSPPVDPALLATLHRIESDRRSLEEALENLAGRLDAALRTTAPE